MAVLREVHLELLLLELVKRNSKNSIGGDCRLTPGLPQHSLSSGPFTVQPSTVLMAKGPSLTLRMTPRGFQDSGHAHVDQKLHLRLNFWQINELQVWPVIQVLLSWDVTRVNRHSMLSEEVRHFTVDITVQFSNFQFSHKGTVHNFLLSHGVQQNLGHPPSEIQLVHETHCTKGR